MSDGGSVTRVGPVGQAATVETHSAVVFMIGNRAYKWKKPVDLGFLDFSTIESRRLACDRELALNRRLAPDVYLGTARVIDDQEQVVEHLLVMRRMPEDRRLDRLLEEGSEIAVALLSIADRLAEFQEAHGVDAETAERLGGAVHLRQLWAGCSSGIRQYGALAVSQSQLAEVERLSERFIAGRGDLFRDRIARGRIRDGHGDLQASDIFCLVDGPRLLDCLDFDADLRIGDVVNDAAFLIMDLEALGHLAAAEIIRDRFLSISPAPSALLHFYEAYRAWVRCEVTALRAGQQEQSPPASTALLARQAQVHLLAARVRLVIIGGLPGSGKSAIAAALAALEPSWILLSSDDIRAEQPSDDAYSDSARDGVYDRMLRRAGEHLSMGETVVLDATWGSHQWRESALLVATQTFSDLIALEVVCSRETAEGRILERRRVGTGSSEATVAVLQDLGERWDSWPDAAVVDGEQPLTEAVAAAHALCG